MKTTNIPIYRGVLLVMITSDVNEVLGFYPEFVGELYAHSLLLDYNGMQGFMCVLNFKASRNITHGCIAHEATHIAHMVLEQRGVFPDFINDEPCAYLVEWITDHIYEACKGYKIKTE